MTPTGMSGPGHGKLIAQVRCTGVSLEPCDPLSCEIIPNWALLVLVRGMFWSRRSLKLSYEGFLALRWDLPVGK